MDTGKDDVVCFTRWLMKHSTVSLIMLGSSASSPLPRTADNVFEDYLDTGGYQKEFALHSDPLCASAARGGKDRRTRSSLAAIVGGRVALFDAGPDIQYQLHKYNLRPDAICITHDHYDASYGTRYLPDVPVYKETDGTLSPGKSFALCGLKITPFRVLHSDTAPAVGFMAEAGGKSFAYMTDMRYLRGARPYLARADVLFADGSILKRSLRGHMAIVQQLRWYRQWGLKRVLFTHIGHATLPHAKLARYVRSRYARAGVAYDGMRLEL